ncbi:MAG TPA: efflux RND transporter permease subunit, partial [Vicinamibacteria bacterium]
MRVGFAGRIAHAFLDSKLTPLLIAASLGLGALALLGTPREEEPQIRVPMVDVTVVWPGAEPAEMETRVVEPLERAMWGISRVEHVYSAARPGVALVTVRFLVNESNEESLVKVYERLSALGSALPPDALPPSVELHSIDDVPFLTLTLWSEAASSDELRPLAAELALELSEVPETSKAYLVGGQPRAVRVEPDPDRLAAAGVSWIALSGALRSAAARQDAGTAVRNNREVRIEAPAPFRSGEDVGRVVAGVRGGRPVYVADVARITDGPGEATDAVFFAVGPARATPGHPAGREHPAVTIALAKRPGANATRLAEEALEKVERLRPRLLPAGVHVEVTRNYGRTAEQKSDELVEHLLIATLSVVVLISLAMGWRSGLVVGIAVPVTLALTLFIYFLAGYTLNRVTLFALIFSIGILVDDAIVVVENIERHHREKPGESFLRVAAEAVDEVGNPTILATFTVIAAILPMAFVRGLMGPYMRPIPTGASAAMLFSLAVAFIVSPWAALRIFRSHAGGKGDEGAEGWQARVYRRAMGALVARPGVRWTFFATVVVVFLAALATVPGGLVRVKMLPFDNKSELQVLVDHDAGTPLEVTLETARRMSRALAEVPEVSDIQIYAGAAAPYNFNGLVRHYFLRRSPSGADLQVNLVGKRERSLQSHDLAKKVRPALREIANARGARVKVVEIPPGPPVLDTMVAEVYGPTARAREGLAGTVRGLFEETAGIVDVDDSLEAPRDRMAVVVDREKAGLKGVSVQAASETIAGPGAGRDVGRLHAPASREPVPVRLRLSAAERGDVDRRLSLRVDAPGGAVALSQIARVEGRPEPPPILHKDLKPVVYVFGDLAGERESPVYALAALDERIDALPPGPDGYVERLAVAAPSTSDRLALKWDGEWQITYEVFRDLGIAFAVVLVLIAILVIGWFQSFTVPLAILLPIPLSLIGILPGHWAFGAFFTATSMIGFIAGAGIIVRNSIILVDFIELKVRQGMPLEEAVVEAGA